MANKIDYKEYLSHLGTYETDAKKRVKDYLEKQIQDDEALRNLYRPEKIDDCYDFIQNAVKAMVHSGGCVAVEDALVWKMARDYFIEILPKTADEPPEVKAAMPQVEGGEKSEASENSEAETEPEQKEEEKAAPADNENETVTDEYGFEVYGEEPETVSETGAETAEEAETEAETEPEAETEITEEEKSAEADNENSGTPCEEAEPENEKPEASETKYDADGNSLLFGF